VDCDDQDVSGALRDNRLFDGFTLWLVCY